MLKLLLIIVSVTDLTVVLVLREEVPTTVSKPVLSWLAKVELPKLSLDAALEVGLYAIESINANRHIAFEEEVSDARFYACFYVGCCHQEGGCQDIRRQAGL